MFPKVFIKQKEKKRKEKKRREGSRQAAPKW
jgi:hypothetical protein